MINKRLAAVSILVAVALVTTVSCITGDSPKDVVPKRVVIEENYTPKTTKAPNIILPEEREVVETTVEEDISEQESIEETSTQEAEVTEVIEEATEVPAQLDEQPVPEESVSSSQYYGEQDVVDIAKVLYNECRGVPSKTEQACVAWTVLNRVDQYGSSVYSVVRAKNQFAFWDSTPVRDDLRDLAIDVLERWNSEKNGATNVGRVLPKDYTYFHGRGGRNYFRNAFSGSFSTWDYSLSSPYES